MGGLLKSLRLYGFGILSPLAVLLAPLSATIPAWATGTTVPLGTNTALSNPGASYTTYKGGTQYTVAATGSLTSLNAYIDGQNATTGSQLLQMAVYSDSANAPAALLVASNSQTIVAGMAAGWVNFPLPSSLNVSAGAKLWLIAYSPSGANVIRSYSDNSTNYTSAYNVNSSNSITSSYGATTKFTGRYALYASETLSPVSTALSTWQAAIAGRSTTPAKWVSIGESLTEGQGASIRSNRWLDLTASQLRSNYPTTTIVGGVNYIPAVYRVYAPDSNWWSPASSYSGNISPTYWAADLGYRALEFTTAATAIYPVTGDSADIWYASGSGGGTFTYAVDGGSPSSVTTNAPTYSTTSQIKSIPLGSPGSHTITITDTSGSVYLEGFSVYNGDRNAGIQMYDSGYSGATVSTFLADLPNFHKTIAAVNPQLVTIELGGNDYLNQTNPATFKSQMLQLVSDLKTLPNTPSIEIIAPYATSIKSNPTYNYGSYVQQLASIAAADPSHVSLLDLSSLMPVADTSGTGYYSVDGMHPNNSGQQVVEQYVYNSLTH